MSPVSDSTGATTTVDHARLARCCTEIFAHAGLERRHAVLFAEALVETDLRAVHSHGVIRVPFYVRRMREGGDNARPNIRIERETVATAVVDGDCGPGHVVSDFASRVAIEKARAAGIGWVGVRNSGHFGAAQLWAMRALEHDMIGMAWTNGPPVMVPWGGRSAGISNNPLAIAVPGGHCAPLVLDSAWSKVAGGKVRLAAKKGEHIPDDWIVDAEGRPSTDPHDLPNGGALLPLGHKGYAMAVMAEALAGVLPGGSILDEMRIWFDIPRDPTRYGHVIAAIQIAAFNDLDGFKGRIDELVAKLKAIEPADDYDEILVPGELEARAAERQRREGILLPTAVVEDLRALARECGLPPELMI